MGPARPIGAVDVRIARSPGGGPRERGAIADEPSSAVALSNAVDPGEPTIDVDRVDMIRRAVQTGEYPVVPAKIADAMIAAGLLLREGKQ
jgi:negative regulator of flagellin synthesis FlgM